jgi:hypothetical protein
MKENAEAMMKTTGSSNYISFTCEENIYFGSGEEKDSMLD